ncbi:unnamed protein product [Orchesella dallaii]|uniref:Gustatory receptor n=1 Tax=Orchesella dallaii TaxID=48710 RepID=A0ABP1Q267_9HEXA
MKAWNYSMMVCVVGGGYSVYSLIRNILKFQSGKVVFMEEIIVNGLVVPMTLQAVVTMHTMERNPEEDTYMTNQILKAGNTEYKGWPNRKRIPDLSELLAYGIAIACSIFPLGTGMYPLVRTRDPINVAVGDLLPEIPRRLIASLVYFMATFFCANICGSFMQLRIAFTHILAKETEENLLNCKSTGIQPTWDFRRSRKLHIQTGMLMSMANKSNEIFVPTMVFVGMIFCIFSLYACLTMYNVPQFRLMMPFCCFLAFSMPIFIAFFAKHASLPLLYSHLTLRFWQEKTVSRVERKQLKALKEVGFEVGNIVKATNLMALQMMDVILNYTITLLLA